MSLCEKLLGTRDHRLLDLLRRRIKQLCQLLYLIDQLCAWSGSIRNSLQVVRGNDTRVVLQS
jgi:hypothetical protein